MSLFLPRPVGRVALLLPLLLAAAVLPVAADDAPDADGFVSRAELVGGPITPVSIDVDLRTLPTVRAWQPGDPVKELPRKTRPTTAAAPLPNGPDEPEFDPLAARQEATAQVTVAGFETPVLDIAGQGYSGVGVPDTVGDVGTDHFVQSINGSIATAYVFYNKATGTVAAGPLRMDDLAPAGSPCANGLGDPIVLFDRMANRWILQEFSGGGNRMCLYVSKSSNPITGGWWFYDVSAPSFPDYPHFGIWSNAIVATTNEGSPVAFYALDRERMLAGQTARAPQRFTVSALGGYSFQTLTAAGIEGPMPPPAGARPLVMRHRDDEAHAGGAADTTKDFLDLYELEISWDVPAMSGVVALPQIPIAEFNSWLVNYTTFNAVPQPGSAARLDPLREVILQKLHYRNAGTHESVVGNFVTNNYTARTGSSVSCGIRWFELRRTGGGPWTLHQEGTFGSTAGNSNRWMAAIGMDSMGNIGLGYNRTDSGPVYPSLWYSGRLATDPPGTITQGDLLLENATTYFAPSNYPRWGDYAALGVDPVDDCTFWFTGELATADKSRWATRISAFRFPGCSCQPNGMTMSTVALTKSGNDVVASWPTAPGAVSHVVERSTVSGSGFTTVAATVTGTTWTDAGVVPSGTTEYYRLFARNACGAVAE